MIDDDELEYQWGSLHSDADPDCTAYQGTKIGFIVDDDGPMIVLAG